MNMQAGLERKQLFPVWSRHRNGRFQSYGSLQLCLKRNAFSVVGRRLQFSSSKEEGTQLVWTYILLLRWYIYNGIGHNFCKLKTPSPVKFWHKIYNITKKNPTIPKVTINCPQLQGIDIARNSVTREVGWHGRSLSKFNVVEFQRKFDWRYQRQKRFAKNLDFELFQDLTWDVPKSYLKL